MELTSRRHNPALGLLIGFIAVIFVAACAPAQPDQAGKTAPRTIVFVHGAWGGGWQYTKVQPLLEAAGYTVYRPTMTGLGERVHLARPDVGLSTHIEDIVNVLEFEDLHDIVLVGHSYGGMVIAGVAERVPRRIAKLVFFDAIGVALYIEVVDPRKVSRPGTLVVSRLGATDQEARPPLGVASQPGTDIPKPGPIGVDVNQPALMQLVPASHQSVEQPLLRRIDREGGPSPARAELDNPLLWPLTHCRAPDIMKATRPRSQRNIHVQ